MSALGREGKRRLKCGLCNSYESFFFFWKSGKNYTEIFLRLGTNHVKMTKSGCKEKSRTNQYINANMKIV